MDEAGHETSFQAMLASLVGPTAQTASSVAAEARITDADSAILAQANQQPTLALTLLRE